MGRLRCRKGMHRGVRELAAEEIERSWVRQLEMSQVLPGHGGCVNSVRWDTRGTLLASGSDDLHVRLWSLRGCNNGMQSEHNLETAHTRNIFDTVFRPIHNDMIVTGGADGMCTTLRLPPYDGVDTTSVLFDDGDCTSKISFQLGSADIFAISCDGRYHNHGSLRCCDLRTKSYQVILDRPCVGVHFSPISEHYVAAGGEQLFICDTRMSGPRSVVEEYTLTPPSDAPNVDLRGASSVMYHPSGRQVLVNMRGEDAGGFLYLVDLREGAQGEGEGDGGNSSTAVTQVYRGAANAQTTAKECAFLQNNNVVACGSDDGCLYMWQTRTAAPLRSIRADKTVVNCVAPHPSLPVVAVSGIDSSVKLLGLPANYETKRPFNDDEKIDTDPALSFHRRMNSSQECIPSHETAPFLEEASSQKEAGSRCVASKEYEAALERYGNALTALDWVAPNSRAREDRDKLILACRLNSALCNVNLQNWRHAIKDSTLALHIDPLNVKAHYRKALALGATNDYDAAVKLCQSLLESKQDPDIAKLLLKLQEKQKKAKKADQERFKGMFE